VRGAWIVRVGRRGGGRKRKPHAFKLGEIFGGMEERVIPKGVLTVKKWWTVSSRQGGHSSHIKRIGGGGRESITMEAYQWLVAPAGRERRKSIFLGRKERRAGTGASSF